MHFMLMLPHSEHGNITLLFMENILLKHPPLEASQDDPKGFFLCLIKSLSLEIN